MRLTDAQWNVLQPLLLSADPPKTPGRPRADDRAVIDGILSVMKTGAP